MKIHSFLLIILFSLVTTSCEPEDERRPDVVGDWMAYSLYTFHEDDYGIYGEDYFKYWEGDKVLSLYGDNTWEEFDGGKIRYGTWDLREESEWWILRLRQNIFPDQKFYILRANDSELVLEEVIGLYNNTYHEETIQIEYNDTFNNEEDE